MNKPRQRTRKGSINKPEQGNARFHELKRTKHTPDWDQRSLGLIEAAALAMAWAAPVGTFVTGNSDEDSEA